MCVRVPHLIIVLLVSPLLVSLGRADAVINTGEVETARHLAAAHDSEAGGEADRADAVARPADGRAAADDASHREVLQLRDSKSLDPTHVGVNVGMKVAVEVNVPQSGAAATSGETASILRSWDSLIKGWGDLAKHLKHRRIGMDILDKWLTTIDELVFIIGKLDDAALHLSKRLGGIKDKTPGLDKALGALGEMISSSFAAIRKHVNLQAGYINADSAEEMDAIDSEFDSFTDFARRIDELDEIIAEAVEGTEVEADYERVKREGFAIHLCLDKATGIAKDAKASLVKAAGLVTDGIDKDSNDYLEAWVLAAAKKDEDLRRQLENAMGGGGSGLAALLQQISSSGVGADKGKLAAAAGANPRKDVSSRWSRAKNSMFGRQKQEQQPQQQALPAGAGVGAEAP